MLQKILFFWKINLIKKKQENSINKKKKENGVASNQILQVSVTNAKNEFICFV